MCTVAIGITLRPKLLLDNLNSLDPRIRNEVCKMKYVRGRGHGGGGGGGGGGHFDRQLRYHVLSGGYG